MIEKFRRMLHIGYKWDDLNGEKLPRGFVIEECLPNSNVLYFYNNVGTT